MNSIPPSAAGVPSSGNGKYAIIALLLVGGIGGLAAWKFTKKDPAAIVTTVTAPETAKPIVRDDDMAPPPEAITAATAAPTAKATATGGGGGTGCPSSCGGSAGSDLQAALALRGRQARKCYERELANDPKLAVHMTMAVRVSSTGAACSANVANSDNPAVAACVANVFRSGGFPAAKGGCADVNIPLNFVPNR